MTARTHDLAAFTTLTIYIATQPVPHMSIATAVTAFGANMIGGLLPDIDDATSDFWDTVRFGTVVSKVMNPLIGNHRRLTHSLVGMAVVGYLLFLLLNAARNVLIVDMNIVWWSAMLGYVSHLIADSFTKEGVPWLLPIPIRMGFPPLRSLRITTGKFMETAIIFPGLLMLNGYLIYSRYPLFVQFFKTLSK